MARSGIDQPLRWIKKTRPLTHQSGNPAIIDLDEQTQDQISGALHGMPRDG
jgi:hypothetical protein